MTEHKKIMINESFFNTTSSGGNKTRKNRGAGRPKKEKPKMVINPNSMKKTLLEKIKKHQQAEKMSKQHASDSMPSNTNGANSRHNDDNKFTDDFMNSMEYLSKLGDKNRRLNKEKKKRNKTQKLPQFGGSNSAMPPNVILPPNIGGSELISIDLPPDFNAPEAPNTTLSMLTSPVYPPVPNPLPSLVPKSNSVHSLVPKHVPNSASGQSIQPVQIPHYNHLKTQNTPLYGCLKGGTKPTYRQYHNKTLKHEHTKINPSPLNNTIKHRQHKLGELKKKYSKIRQKKRTVRKTTYSLGKKGGKLSILIKNNATRRKVRREHGLLRQKSINEVKQYLYNKNLLKIGSDAPNDVLRTLYEQAILAGDVTNTSSDIQFHNFMNQK